MVGMKKSKEGNWSFFVKISGKDQEYFVENNHGDYEDYLDAVQKRFSHKPILSWIFLPTAIVFLIFGYIGFFQILEIFEVIDMTNPKRLDKIVLYTGLFFLFLSPFTIIFDIKKGKIKIEYCISEGYKNRLDDFYETLFSLNKSDKLWLIYSEKRHNDGKRHAGASSSVKRREIYVHNNILNKPKFNIEVPVINFYPSIIFLPDAIWIVHENTIESVSYNDLQFELCTTNFRESSDFPKDSELIGKTWEKVNADGSPDRRFSDNSQVYILKYFEIKMFDSNGFHLDLLVSNYEIGKEFARKFREYAESE